MAPCTAREASPAPSGPARLAMWTEGGPGIGMGHVVRTLVVAEELRARGVDVSFFVNDDQATIRRIADRGFDVAIALFDGKGCGLLLESRPKAVLLDTKRPVAGLLKRLRQGSCRGILMDHLCEENIEADAHIIPSAFWSGKPSAEEAGTGFFGGAPYVPISETYRSLTPAAAFSPPPWRILVTMGGSDPNRLTFRVASVLQDLGGDVSAILVIGPSFPEDGRLDEIVRATGQRIRCVRGVWDLSGLMAEAHVVVTGLGTTIYEAAYLGRPVLVIGNYESDVGEMEILEAMGIGLGAGYHGEIDDARIRFCIERLIYDADLYRRISAQGRTLIDGLGARRIADAVLPFLGKED